MALAEEREANVATELARTRRIEAKKKLIAALKAAEDLKQKHAEKEKILA